MYYRFHLVNDFRTQFHFRTEYSLLDTKIWFTNENAILEPKIVFKNRNLHLRNQFCIWLKNQFDA